MKYSSLAGTQEKTSRRTMSGDDTEIGIEALTEDMEPHQRNAIRRMWRRNNMVSKILIRGTIIILTSILVGIGAYFSGLINVVD